MTPTSPTNPPAQSCGPFNFRYSEEGRVKLIRTRACVTEGFILSEGCVGLNCELFNKMKDQRFQTRESSNPGFALCHRNGGRPVIGSYFSQRSRQNRNISLCFDENFNQFVPISLLIRVAAGASIPNQNQPPRRGPNVPDTGDNESGGQPARQ